MKRNVTTGVWLGLALCVCAPSAAWAQIVPSMNDAGSHVQNAVTNPQQLNISGGTQVGQNLFHSFQTFGVNVGQIANFQSNPTIHNILGRVTGGDASIINGRLQVTGGSSHLFLMNSAGILFGPNASLNLPASFTATTANGIGFGNAWFNAVGTNDYNQLISSPNQFAFTTANPGAIVNSGNLSLNAGQHLTLLGGTVMNTGTIVVPGGTVTIAAVPGKQEVRMSQSGSLLSLVLPLETQGAINPAIVPPASLPELLTGRGMNSATGVTVENGIVTLTSSGIQIPNQSGVAIVSNQIDVSGVMGGKVDVLGKTVGILDAKINASGLNGGGQVRIGGDYQGKGTVPNATRSIVNASSQIQANAIESGNGGHVIVWADDTTSFTGNITARGGEQSGNGGLVEVSGKQHLAYDGTVDLQASHGSGGLLFLDPSNVTIDYLTTDDAQLNDQQILLGDGGNSTFNISSSKLKTALNTGNVSIAASNKISINDNVLALANPNTFDLTLIAPTISLSYGRFLEVNGTITLQGQTINLAPISKINAAANVIVNATQDFIAENSQIKAGNDLQIISPKISLLGGNKLTSGRDLTLLGGQSLQVEDTFVPTGLGVSQIQASRDLLLQGTQNVTLQTDKNPASIFKSGRDLTIASDGLITANATFNSGMNFITRRVSDANPATVQITNPNFNSIVSAGGDVNFGNYEGLSLKVEAKGSITGGDIKILGENPTLIGADPDIAQLRTRPLLILNAGVTTLTTFTNLPTALGGTIITTNGTPSVGKITVGNIQIPEPLLPGSPPIQGDSTLQGVILSAIGSITTGNITTKGQSMTLETTAGDVTTGALLTGGLDGARKSSVTINANAGNVTVKSIDTGSGGLIVNALGTFQAIGSFNGGLLQNEGILVKDNPALIDFLLANLPGITREQLLTSNTRIPVDTDSLPISIIARPTNISDPNNARILIRHGGVSVGTIGDRIQVQGSGGPIGFKSGPLTTVQGSGFEVTSGNISDFNPQLPNQFFKLTRTETYQTLNGLSIGTSGTIGGIVIGAGSNSNLYASFRDRSFDAPLPNPVAQSTGSNNPVVSPKTVPDSTLEGTQNRNGIRSLSSCPTNRDSSSTGKIKPTEAVANPCQPSDDDSVILKILDTPKNDR